MRRLGLLLLACATASAGTLVTQWGAVVRGDVRVEGDVVVLTKGTKERREPVADYLLVEADDGRLLYAPRFEARLRGCEYIARDLRAALASKLVDDALAARDGQLARRCLDLAESSGFTGKEAEALKKRVEDVEKRNPTPDMNKAGAVAARLAGAASIHPDLLVQRARADAGDDGLRLLREALRLDPKHAGALALLGERAPKDFPLGSPALWLDWRLDLESRGAAFVPEKEPVLVQQRATWRKDVYGIEAGQIRMLTPVTHTATVGRCLAYGQVACAAMADFFKTPEPRARMSKTLLILLYPTKEEYLKQSVTAGPGEDRERAHLETTAGHHSPAEQVSRVVWDPDPDTERQTARVFVHELAHHWITDLNPRYSNKELQLINVSAPWIVEGIATFFEEGVYDPERGTWSLFDARSASLDTVLAVSKAKRLLPWKDVYTMDWRGFRQLSRKAEDGVPVVRRWHLGTILLPPGGLFYDQSAATVHFLCHGEGGVHREKLVEYITHRYTGKKDKLAIETAFGMTPDELGAKVLAYAQRVAEGWRP